MADPFNLNDKSRPMISSNFSLRFSPRNDNNLDTNYYIASLCFLHDIISVLKFVMRV